MKTKSYNAIFLYAYIKTFVWQMSAHSGIEEGEK